jgi:hypothetical protein
MLQIKRNKRRMKKMVRITIKMIVEATEEEDVEEVEGNVEEEANMKLDMVITTIIEIKSNRISRFNNKFKLIITMLMLIAMK